jgi:hypothetical protein
MTKLKINNDALELIFTTYPIVKESLEHGGYLVGSSANYLITGMNYNDIDILFTNEELHSTLTRRFITEYKYIVNKFGGLRYTCNNMDVDIWYSSLDRYIMKHNSKEVGYSYIYNYTSNTVIEFKNNNCIST